MASRQMIPEFISVLLCAGANPYLSVYGNMSALKLLEKGKQECKKPSEKKAARIKECEQLFDAYDKYKALLTLRDQQRTWMPRELIELLKPYAIMANFSRNS